MSDHPPDDLPPLRLVLCCEECETEFRPEEFGAPTVREVPHDASCPRCGGPLCEVDPD